jgi:hypothetical protein
VVNEFLNNSLSQYRDRVTVARFRQIADLFCHSGDLNHSAAASQRSCPLSEDRPFTPSFWKILCRCSFTVPLLSPSSRATSLLDKPRATRHATSRSRRVNIRTDNLLVPRRTRDQPIRLQMSELSGCWSNSHAKQWCEDLHICSTLTGHQSVPCTNWFHPLTPTVPSINPNNDIHISCPILFNRRLACAASAVPLSGFRDRFVAC